MEEKTYNMTCIIYVKTKCNIKDVVNTYMKHMGGYREYIIKI